jgi:hypothetical protein
MPDESDKPDRPDERDHFDRGHGDVDLFPAEDLERLYRTGATSGMKISGKALNKIKNTNQYVASAFYLVTDKGVRRI